MPQIAQITEIYASQLFWLAIFFGLSIIVIGYGMLPKIMKTVEDRDAKIAADLAEAKSAQENADGLEEGYREKLDESRAHAHKLTSDAKATAAKKTEASLKRAETSIDKKLGEAAEELAAARTEALKELEAVATEATQDMVAKVSGLKVTKTDAKKVVTKELKHA